MDKDERRELQEELSKLKSLTGSPGFLWERENAQGDVESRITRLVTTPPTSIEALMGIVYDLGICSGIKHTMERPLLRVDVLEEELASLPEDEENGDEEDL